MELLGLYINRTLKPYDTMFAAARRVTATASLSALASRRAASGLAAMAPDAAVALSAAEQAKEKRLIKSLGANFLSEANDLKRPLPIVAEELDVPLETLESFVEVRPFSTRARSHEHPRYTSTDSHTHTPHAALLLHSLENSCIPRESAAPTRQNPRARSPPRPPSV